MARCLRSLFSAVAWRPRVANSHVCSHFHAGLCVCVSCVFPCTPLLIHVLTHVQAGLQFAHVLTHVPAGLQFTHVHTNIHVVLQFTHVLTHVQAGLQPACVLLRVCNPRHACFVHFPGSQTRPRALAGCKPARTWMLAWVFAWVFVFGGCVFAWLFVKDFCQSCRGKGLQANPLTHKRIRKRPVLQCKTGRLGLPDRPFRRAKEAVWHGHTAGMARRAPVCKYFSRCGRRGGRGASSLRQYDAVQAMPAAITRSRMALSCSGVALRSSRSGVSRSMVYIITLPGAMYLTFSSHGPT